MALLNLPSTFTIKNSPDPAVHWLFITASLIHAHFIVVDLHQNLMLSNKIGLPDPAVYRLQNFSSLERNLDPKPNSNLF
eukprot:1134761-Pelagomonas_calceolata.AAC.3